MSDVFLLLPPHLCPGEVVADIFARIHLQSGFLVQQRLYPWLVIAAVFYHTCFLRCNPIWLAESDQVDQGLVQTLHQLTPNLQPLPLLLFLGMISSSCFSRCLLRLDSRHLQLVVQAVPSLSTCILANSCSLNAGKSSFLPERASLPNLECLRLVISVSRCGYNFSDICGSDCDSQSGLVSYCLGP